MLLGLHAAFAEDLIVFLSSLQIMTDIFWIVKLVNSSVSEGLASMK